MASVAMQLEGSSIPNSCGGVCLNEAVLLHRSGPQGPGSARSIAGVDMLELWWVWHAALTAAKTGQLDVQPCCSFFAGMPFVKANLHTCRTCVMPDCLSPCRFCSDMNEPMNRPPAPLLPASIRTGASSMVSYMSSSLSSSGSWYGSSSTVLRICVLPALGWLSCLHQQQPGRATPDPGCPHIQNIIKKEKLVISRNLFVPAQLAATRVREQA